MLPFAIPGLPVVVRLHLSATAIARNAGRYPNVAVMVFEWMTLAVHRVWLGVSGHAVTLTQQEFGITPSTLEVIPCPIERVEESISAAPPPAPFVLFAGSISRRKGALLLASAVAPLLCTHSDMHLVYAGQLDPACGDEIREAIRKIVGDASWGRVLFPGHLAAAELRSFMARALVFVLPSELETFGLVVAEAMLTGCPVVTFSDPPFIDFVEDGVSGLLVRRGDSLGLTAAICRLIDSPALARELGLSGMRSIATRFSVAGVTSKTLAFFREVSNGFDSRGTNALKR
jgi:glycosyltransferase involved in cell wall biosynthesis